MLPSTSLLWRLLPGPCTWHSHPRVGAPPTRSLGSKHHHGQASKSLQGGDGVAARGVPVRAAARSGEDGAAGPPWRPSARGTRFSGRDRHVDGDANAADETLLPCTYLLARQVVALSSARILGVVTQLWVDAEQQRVVALWLGAGLFSRDEGLLPLTKIRQIGDVILVDSEEALERRPAPAMLGCETLVGEDVTTEGGLFIGKVRDYVFSPDTGYIVSFVVDPLGLPLVPASLVSTYSIAVDELMYIQAKEIVVREGADSRWEQLTQGFSLPLHWRKLYRPVRDPTVRSTPKAWRRSAGEGPWGKTSSADTVQPQLQSGMHLPRSSQDLRTTDHFIYGRDLRIVPDNEGNRSLQYDEAVPISKPSGPRSVYFLASGTRLEGQDWVEDMQAVSNVPVRAWQRVRPSNGRVEAETSHEAGGREEISTKTPRRQSQNRPLIDQSATEQTDGKERSLSPLDYT